MKNSRRGRPNEKRASLTLVEQVLGLYREKYFDLNVRHFHEKLREEHGIALSYTWVKLARQGAGLVAGAQAGLAPQMARDGGLCRTCCCTSTAAVISGFRMIAGAT